MNVNYALRRARRFHGHSPAIDHPGLHLSYEEFARQVELSGQRLAALGIRKGDRIAVLMGNSPTYLDLYFSLPLVGALIVPLNTRWSLNEIAFTLNDSGSARLIVDQRFSCMVSGLRDAVPCLQQILLDSDLPAIVPAAIDFEEPHEDDLVGLFYTSGTTGGPKGAMLSHRNLYSNAVHQLLPPSFLGGLSRYLHAAPMFHLADAGAILALTLTGSCHSFLEAFDPAKLLEALERHRIDGTLLVPTMINLMLHCPSFDACDLSALKRIAYGASPMPLPLLQAARRKLPHCEFSQGYGMTEVSPLLTSLQPHDHDGPAVSSAGRPVIGVEVRVVDDLDRDVPTGQPGEIVARGPNVMRGYWNRPEINAEALRGGWMHTGDIGRFDEAGYLYIMDRKKDMIKPGSENVHSPEVESVICAHPAVLEAAVIGVPDPKWGEAIWAVVALRPAMQATPEELIAFCRERLTHFKCPVAVRFVDALPKGGTGKVQKSILRERYGSMEQGSGLSAQSCASPSG